MMKKDTSVLLPVLIAQVVFCCTVAVDYKRELTSCHGNKLHYETGEPMELCCTTDYPPCLQNSTLLTIHKTGMEAEHGLNWTLTHLKGSYSSVQLTVPFPQENDSGMYTCYCNGKRLMNGRVSVIGKVHPPSIISVTSTMLGNLTVIFDPGESKLGYLDIYTVLAQVEAEKVVLCENGTISCRKGSCTCKERLYTRFGSPEAPSLDFTLRNVTIIVTKKRLTVQNEVLASFNLIKLVKPGPVDVLQVREVRSTSAALDMCAPNHFSSFAAIGMMKEEKSPFRMYISVYKTQGVFEERKFDVPFKFLFQPCLQVSLSQLTPFTTYNVSVTTAGGGGNSTPTYLSFTTDGAAPLSPPEDVVYWVQQDGRNIPSKQNLYTININWKPIPHDEKGGNISYEVTVSYKEMTFNHTVIESHIVLHSIPVTPVAVNICSKNEMGVSKNCSFLYIKSSFAHTGFEQLKSLVEISGSNAFVSIERPPRGTIISAIYSCFGEKSTQVVCKKYPRLMSDGRDFHYGIDALSASISLERKECQTETVSESRQESCKFLETLDDDEPKSSENDYTVTRLLDIQNGLCTSRSLHDDDVFKGHTVQPSLQHKFLFSIDRSPQLYPFKCYYSNEFDTVHFYYNQSENGDAVALSWNQRCDDVPGQFLAKEYKVYSSNDVTCRNVSRDFTKVANTLMRYSTLKMSSEDKFACIVSFKLYNGKLVPSKVIPHQMDKQSIVHVKNVDNDSSLPLVIGLCVGALGIIIIIVIIYRVNKRGRWIGKSFKMLQPEQVCEPSENDKSVDSNETDAETGLGSSIGYEQIKETPAGSSNFLTPDGLDLRTCVISKSDSLFGNTGDSRIDSHLMSNDPAEVSEVRLDNLSDSGHVAGCSSESSQDSQSNNSSNNDAIVLESRPKTFAERMERQLISQGFDLNC